MEPSIYRLRLQDLLMLCVLCLLFLGMLMVQSAAMNVPDQVQDARWRLNDRGVRQLLYASVALVTFLIVGKLDYRFLARRATWTNPVLLAMAIALAALAAVLVPGLVRPINGARRWLPLGPIQVQPSELAKWAIVLFLAWWLTVRLIDPRRFIGFVITMIPVALVCLLVVIEDFGTAALIGLCAVTICIAGGVKLWHMGLFIPPALAAGVGFVILEPYRVARLLAFRDPLAAPRGEGYHMIQSILSFATGGVYGRGLGQGIQKLGYLPEDTTDFIFAVICEELGLFGALMVIVLYVAILYVSWQVVGHNKDPFARLLAFGVGTMIGLQALINIAVATVSIPPKGMSLPLVSAGGSGLVITSAALGLLYSICRRQEAQAELEALHQQSTADPKEQPLTAAA